MSRMGKKPIKLESAAAEVNGQEITVKGPKGQSHMSVDPLLTIVHQEGTLSLKMRKDTKQSRACLGMQRSLLNNMIEGVLRGFEVSVLISGVGYRAIMEGSKIQVIVGKSHTEFIDVPSDVKVTIQKPTELVFSGINKQKIGQLVSIFCRLRPVEPYKAKGIYRKGQKIVRKEGKKK